MSPADLGTLVFLNIVGAASPGPDIVLITRTAVRSRRHAVATVLGIQVGVLLWLMLTVVGAAALLNALPWIFEFVQVIGGAWITYLGISMVRGGWAERHNPPTDTEEAEARLGRLRSAFIKGLTTNLSNPKIVLFLSALIAPLLPPSPTVMTAVIVILALWISSMLFQLAIAWFVSTATIRRKMLSAGPYIDMGAGAFFIVAGVILVWRGMTGLLS